MDTQGILNAIFDPTNNALRVSGPASERIWLPAGNFVPGAGATTLAAAPSGGLGRWLLDGAATEAVSTTFRLPSYWATWNLFVYYVNETVGTGNIRWSVSFQTLPSGSLTTAAATTTTATTIASGAQNVIGAVTGLANQATPEPSFGFGGFASLTVSRLGGDALDTHAGDIGMVGAAIERAS